MHYRYKGQIYFIFFSNSVVYFTNDRLTGKLNFVYKPGKIGKHNEKERKKTVNQKYFL